MEKSKLAHTVGLEINIAKAKSIRIILSSKSRCGQARKSTEDKAQKIPHMPEVNGKIPNIQQQAALRGCCLTGIHKEAEFVTG